MAKDVIKKVYFEALLVMLNEVEQIQWKVLKNQVYFSFFLESLPNSNYMIAFEHFEHTDLPLDGSFGILIFIGLLELLDSNYITIMNSIPNYWVSLLVAFHTIP